MYTNICACDSISIQQSPYQFSHFQVSKVGHILSPKTIDFPLELKYKVGHNLQTYLDNLLFKQANTLLKRHTAIHDGNTCCGNSGQ